MVSSWCQHSGICGSFYNKNVGSLLCIPGLGGLTARDLACLLYWDIAVHSWQRSPPLWNKRELALVYNSRLVQICQNAFPDLKTEIEVCFLHRFVPQQEWYMGIRMRVAIYRKKRLSLSYWHLCLSSLHSQPGKDGQRLKGESSSVSPPYFSPFSYWAFSFCHLLAFSQLEPGKTPESGVRQGSFFFFLTKP